MRIAVVGGTGTVGRRAVAAVTRAGHEAIALSRSTGVDVVSGAGLEVALTDVDVVVDASNVATTKASSAHRFFTDGTRNLLAAEQRAGVRHHVLLSIVGIDSVPWGYYQAKLAQERLVIDGPIRWSVLRATQFHEFAGQILTQTRRGPIALAPTMLIQPVAADDVAAALAEAAAGTPAGRLPDLAGPEPRRLAPMLRAVARSRGARTLVVPVRLPGPAGKAMASGALLPGPDARRTTRGFDEWLAATGRS